MGEKFSLDVEKHLPPLLSKVVPLKEALSNWKLIESALEHYGITDDTNRAAMLATVLVETAHTLRPIHEYGNQAYFIKHYWQNVRTAKALGNILEADAYEYCGRGFIQTTGRNNYEKAAKELNLPLMSQPELLLQPTHSAMAAAFFWKTHGLPQMCAMVDKTPDADGRLIYWQSVRRRVNGGLNGFLGFTNALKELGAL